jgi:hypothetical protein
VEGSKVDNEDLFQTLNTNIKIMSQIVARELNAFGHRHVDVENYKRTLSWWHIHEQRWRVAGSLAQ